MGKVAEGVGGDQGSSRQVGVLVGVAMGFVDFQGDIFWIPTRTTSW